MDCGGFDDGDLSAIVRAGVSSFSSSSNFSLNPNLPPALIPDCHSSPNLSSTYICSSASASSSVSLSGPPALGSSSLSPIAANLASNCMGSCAASAAASIEQNGNLGSVTLTGRGLRDILNSAIHMNSETGICRTWALHSSSSNSNSGCSSSNFWARPAGCSLMQAADPSSSTASATGGRGTKRSRKSQQKRVVHVPAPGPAPSRAGAGESVPSDLWAWRKYGQKPIKGSPHPRGYYRCSSSKGCPARKQVERSQADPTMLVITYTGEHNHSWPSSGSSYRGVITASATTASKSPQSQSKPPKSPLSSNTSCISVGPHHSEEEERMAMASPSSDSEQESVSADNDMCTSSSTSASGCSSSAAAAVAYETNMGPGLAEPQLSQTISSTTSSSGVSLENEAYLHEALFAEMFEDMHRQDWNWNWNGNVEENNMNNDIMIVEEQSLVDPFDLFNSWSSTSTINNVPLLPKVNVLDMVTS